MFSVSAHLREITVIPIIIRIATNVRLCMLSSSVFAVEEGTIDSIIYLFPTAANISPTQSPSLSASEGFIRKPSSAIENAT